MKVNLTPDGAYTATNNTFNILATLFAGMFALIALIQLYFLFGEKKDLLAGLGFVHTAPDPLDKALFFIAVAIVCIAIALKRGLVLIAVLFGLMYLTSLYGNSFHIRADQNFSLASLPGAGTSRVPANPPPSKPAQKKAAEDRQQPTGNPSIQDHSVAQHWMRVMSKRGFVRGAVLTDAGRDWCHEDKDKDGTPNGQETIHAKGNCNTGFVWSQPE